MFGGHLHLMVIANTRLKTLLDPSPDHERGLEWVGPERVEPEQVGPERVGPEWDRSRT